MVSGSSSTSRRSRDTRTARGDTALPNHDRSTRCHCGLSSHYTCPVSRRDLAASMGRACKLLRSVCVFVLMAHPALDEVFPVIIEELRDSRFLLKLLHAEGPHAWPTPRLEEVFIWAASVGSLSVLAAVEERWNAAWKRLIAFHAVRNGHLDVVQWLYARAFVPYETVADLILTAAQFGRIACLQWLIATFHVPRRVVADALGELSSNADDLEPLYAYLLHLSQY